MAVIAHRERELAAEMDHGEYICCDEAASIMSQLLRERGIHHEVVVGSSDEGSSHAWVRIAGRNFDPTEQGFGDGTFTVSEAY